MECFDGPYATVAHLISGISNKNYLWIDVDMHIIFITIFTSENKFNIMCLFDHIDSCYLARSAKVAERAICFHYFIVM